MAGVHRSFFLIKGEKKMKDNIAAITYNLSFIVKRLEQLKYEAVDYEVEEKLKRINEKVYDLSSSIEELEVLFE